MLLASPTRRWLFKRKVTAAFIRIIRYSIKFYGKQIRIPRSLSRTIAWHRASTIDLSAASPTVMEMTHLLARRAVKLVESQRESHHSTSGPEKNTRIDVAEHPLILAGVLTLGGNARKIDIKIDIFWQVRLARLNYLVSQLRCKTSVNLAHVGHSGGVPRKATVAFSWGRKGKGGNICFARGRNNGADSTREID